MKLERTKEYQFTHPSGVFTGSILAIEPKLIRVQLTSYAKSETPFFDDSGYQPGEYRWINPIRCLNIQVV